MKGLLKSKLKQFLGINKLQDDFIENKLRWQNTSTILFGKLENLEYENSKLKELNEFLVSQFNISADLGNPEYHNNWAVLSIKGKQDYVRFLDLSQKDIREIHMFLKRFEGTNRIIDTPFRFF